MHKPYDTATNEILGHGPNSWMAYLQLPATAGKIMAATLLMAGLRLSDPEITDLRRRLRTMNILKDSSFSRVLLKEGREEGRKEGRKEGEKKGQIAGAQKLLFHLGRSRLGPISKKTRVAIEAIDDISRLERLGERLLKVASWAELLVEAE
jgi:predicted transposase YdaD